MSTIDQSDGFDGDGNPLVAVAKAYGSPYGLQFTVGLVGLFLARIPQRIPALLFGVALDAILLNSSAYTLPLVPNSWIPTTTWGQIWFTAAIVGGAVTAESLLHWVARHNYGQATLKTLHDVRCETYDTVVGLSLEYFDDEQSGEIMSILNNDVNNMEDFADALRRGVTYTGEIGMAFVFMAVLQWELTLVMLVIPVALAVASRFYGNLLEPRYDAVRQSVGTVNSRLRDTVDGISTVKAFNREEFEVDRVEDTSEEYKLTKWAAIRLRLLYSGTTFLVGSFSSWGLFLIGGYWILVGPPLFFSNPLSPGVLLTFMIYAGTFLQPIRQLAVDVIDQYENALASSKRVLGLLHNDAVAEDLTAGEQMDVTAGNVEYDDVTFSYPGVEEETLSGIDFTADAGQLVGVVGSTGAGKSTLMKLLFRLYEPDSGTITIDGQDVCDASLASLREHLGYVSQDPFLFYGTVRDNIAYAHPDADDEDVEAAARLAGAHEFVTGLSDGYDTMVGERGVKLSGGQRQRISIARAILRDPEILILDEATSHVDNETERQIQHSLDEVAANRTTFVIAHRLSTVRHADVILVLDDGELVERGTHDELIARDGTYANLWRVQVGEANAVSEEFVQRAIEREEVAK